MYLLILGIVFFSLKKSTYSVSLNTVFYILPFGFPTKESYYRERERKKNVFLMNKSLHILVKYML